MIFAGVFVRSGGESLQSLRCRLGAGAGRIVRLNILYINAIVLMPSRLSRVRPGVRSTKAIFFPINLLKRVDFPTFGLPIIDMVNISSFL